MFPAAISRERVGNSMSSDGSTAWIVEVGSAIEVSRIGFSPVLIVVITEPVVSGVAVLSVGRISAIPEDVDVVRISTSGVTAELTIVAGAEVPNGPTDPNVADGSGAADLSVIQLTTITGGVHSRLLVKSAGAAVAVSACTMVSHVEDFIVTDDVKE